MQMSSPARGTWIEIDDELEIIMRDESSPARGTWIEMINPDPERPYIGTSSPARGTWIEIIQFIFIRFAIACRPPHGGRGLKCNLRGRLMPPGQSRPPHGGRGLKCARDRPVRPPPRSSPARGTWIEIFAGRSIDPCHTSSSPARGTWIEITYHAD